jgi:hypothetical protein
MDDEQDLSPEFVAAVAKRRADAEKRDARRKSLPLPGQTGDRKLCVKVLAVGREFDVNKAGLYDARSGCVNIWASPEDKPSGWNTVITRGGLKHPRALVGSLGWEWTGDDAVQFVYDVSPYDLLPGRSTAGWHLIADDLWASCAAWVQEKSLALLRLARMHEAYLGAGCPWCSFILAPGNLFNDMVSHAVHAHGLVYAVVLGERTEIVLKDGRRGAVRDITDVRPEG